MNIIYCEDYDEMSRKAGAIMASQLILKPDSVLGLATGSTPVGLYDNLVSRFENGDVSFKDVVTYNLDEYIGLGPDHSQSYAYFMEKHLFSRVDIKKENTHIPDGLAKDPETECVDYSEMISSLPSGLDIQLLGIGANGHIGFNEPNDHFELDTHIIELTDSTIDANMRFFSNRNEVPKRAVTVGLRPIMYANQVLLLASGAAKSDILEAALFGKVSPNIPASLLQLHKGLTVIADKDALKKILELHPGEVL